MKGDIYWDDLKFPGRIALLARPRGGDWLDDEADGWARSGIEVVVSMLERAENEEFELEGEAGACERNGIEFISFPVPDRGVPSPGLEFLPLVERLRKKLASGGNVGIHCRQSIGRAPLLAGVLMATMGIEPAEAFKRLSLARGREVPETAEQFEWVEEIAKRFAAVPV